jgi:hypothetical protein
MAGINRRSLPPLMRKAFLEHSSKPCVFVSHASYYNDTAQEIGDYLQQVVGVDVYLALNDSQLASAVAVRDHKRIVEHIESGIRNSTHLLSRSTEVF